MPCSIVSHRGLVGVSTGCPRATGMSLTRYAPFRRSPPGYCYPALPLDLHVLSLPLAFILSQDQTLLCIIHIFPVRPRQLHSSKKKNQRSHFVLGTCCTNLSILSMNFPVISETGCKDSDFFVPSKLFLTFFSFSRKN